MWGFFQKKRERDQARELLRHARHFRHMREDVMEPARMDELRRLESALHAQLGQGSEAARSHAFEGLEAWLVEHTPARAHPGLRENLEILIVAIGIAMACRTYFIQPFKIPTGSMQPTLHGILYESRESRGIMDHLPLSAVQWLITGDWYMQVRTRESGYVQSLQPDPQDSGRYLCRVGKHVYRVPLASGPRVSPGAFLPKGSLLWQGVQKAGDHVFVDRVRWNLTKPERGQIVVFGTDGIRSLPPKTHYIKRLVGLPGEAVSIQPPDLVVNGAACREPESIARIARQDPGYAGFRLLDARTDVDPASWAMRHPDDVLNLGANEFLAMGDNTQNSRDGRYWGAVPRRNMVGPAVFVYWPFTSRWGLAR